MIKKTSSGFQVKSKSGKALSKPNPTKKQATKRLQQLNQDILDPLIERQFNITVQLGLIPLEFFKHKGKKK